MSAKQGPCGRGALARLRRRAADADGMSIVELVVAISVMTITLSGVASGLTGALGLTRQNRSRTVAANLAAGEMETVRAASVTSAGFTSLQPPAFTETAVTERTATVGSLPYTVRRETEWVSQNSTAGLCDGPANRAGRVVLAHRPVRRRAGLARSRNNFQWVAQGVVITLRHLSSTQRTHRHHSAPEVHP